MFGLGRRIARGCLTAAAITALTATGATPALAARRAAPAAAPAWRVQSSPNATVPSGTIDSVSCSSANACTAVGFSGSGSGLSVTLAERWNGATWRRQATPDPARVTAPAGSPELVSVSCPAATFCEAVGTYSVGAAGFSFGQSWNGRSWSLQPVPAPPGSESATLTRVSCVSARFCEAIGSYRDSIGKNLPYTAAWAGASWRLQRTPVPAGATQVFLNGLSCVSATFCEAGGGADSTGTFAMRWDGRSWQSQAVPGNTGIGAISCVSPSFCEAVGSGGGETWNGTSWSSQAIPAPAGAIWESLSGVSCPAAGYCEAVGWYTEASGDRLALSATWNGTTWSSLAAPGPAGASSTTLSDVSCPATALCEAGGYFSPRGSSFQIALAEAWQGGAWRIQSAVTPPAATGNGLSAVSCPTPAFCEAVGSETDAAFETVALAEVWDGGKWKIQPAASPVPAVSGFRMSLFAVSCVSARFCEAVGASSAGGGAEVWNGTSWQLQAAPGGALTSVSCVSPAFCLATGSDGHLEFWTGASWTPRPDSLGFSSLSAVSCVSPVSCEAVGFGPSGAAAEGWNGTSWSAQAVPTPAGGSSAGLAGISCAGPKFCVAVGSYSGSSFQAVTLAETWNGTAWTARPSPNPAASLGSYLRAVSCSSATFCAAVGEYSVAVPSLALAEVWNGVKWVSRSAPSLRYAGQNVLNGVSCGGHACTAAGVTTDPGQNSATLIETGA